MIGIGNCLTCRYMERVVERGTGEKFLYCSHPTSPYGQGVCSETDPDYEMIADCEDFETEAQDGK